MKEHLRQFIVANKKLMSEISEEGLEDIRCIMVSKSATRILAYFCKHTEGTAKDVMEGTGLSDKSVYRALVKLRRMEIIKAYRIPPRPRDSLGGPRETVWRLK